MKVAIIGEGDHIGLKHQIELLQDKFGNELEIVTIEDSNGGVFSEMSTNPIGLLADDLLLPIAKHIDEFPTKRKGHERPYKFHK